MLPVGKFNIAGLSNLFYRFLGVRAIKQGPNLPWKTHFVLVGR